MRRFIQEFTVRGVVAGWRSAARGRDTWRAFVRRVFPGLAVGMVCLAASVSAVDTGAPAPRATVVDWVRAGLNTNRPTWGVRGGLQWGLPLGVDRSDGPRGLIRLRYPVLPDGGCDLINFIAIEPVVAGQKGFSELEPSQLDGVQGKRLWATDPGTSTAPAPHLVAGQVARLDSGVETLAVNVRVERFENGAQIGLTVTQRSDEPDELDLTLHLEPDSAAIEYCILTATMGNKARARQLWLKDEVVRSLDLYAGYQDAGFAPHHFFPLARLEHNSAGDVLAAITTDEPDPAAADPSPAAAHWRYRGFPVTQYWRKPAGTWRPDLHVAVNGRYTYWKSTHPIPGGVAFENFEMRERFHSGQRFVFGMTRRTPKQLAAPAELRVRVVDAGTRQPVACTVRLVDASGRVVTEGEGLRDGFRSAGVFTKNLPPGVTTLRVMRGPEFKAVEQELTLQAGAVTELELVMERQVDLRRRGWVGGDSHLHMIHGERTVTVDFDQVALAAQAEDLQYFELPAARP